MMKPGCRLLKPSVLLSALLLMKRSPVQTEVMLQQHLCSSVQQPPLVQTHNASYLVKLTNTSCCRHTLLPLTDVDWSEPCDDLTTWPDRISLQCSCKRCCLAGLRDAISIRTSWYLWPQRPAWRLFCSLHVISFNHFVALGELSIDFVCLHFASCAVSTHQGGKKSLKWHNNIYKHSQLQKCTDKLSRGWKPSDDLHFCIERFTVLHRSFSYFFNIN